MQMNSIAIRENLQDLNDSILSSFIVHSDKISFNFSNK